MAYDFISYKPNGNSLRRNSTSEYYRNIQRPALQLYISTYAANQLAAEVLPIVSVIAILWILISYSAGQSFILSAAGVEFTVKNALEIIRIVENTAITAGLPTPKVYVINDDALNAFATPEETQNILI
ncbi:MAG: hypothetical protein LBS81_05385 [Endomicrobium sp.]|jgi:heat shock protein HtpX|nr:hypothetical protein [Endomicrobium sp.]